MTKVLGWMVVGCLALGCRSAPPPAPPPVAVQPTPTVPMLFVHRVNFSGQTLSSISKWYTGDSSNWRNLTDPVNTGLTECCAKLRVGRVIYLPRNLVTQTKPMPYPKKVTRPAKPLVAEEPKAQEEPAEEPKAEEPKSEDPKAEGPEAGEPKAEEPAAPEPAPAEDEPEEEEIIGPR